MNPLCLASTGKVCGVRVEDIERPHHARDSQLDKLVRRAGQGRPMERVLRG